MRAVDPEGSAPDAQDEVAGEEAAPDEIAAGELTEAAHEAPAEPDEGDRIAVLERTLKEAQDGRLRIAADSTTTASARAGMPTMPLAAPARRR